MGQLSNWIQDYRNQKITFEQLQANLAGFSFKVPVRLQNIPEDPFEFDDALDDATYDDPDTWDEVESMYYAKGLTREEYFALLRSTQEAKAGASPPTNAGESEGGQ